MSAAGWDALRRRTDTEALAVLAILDDPTKTLWHKADPYVDDDGGIDFAAMLSAHDREDADDGICKTWNKPEEPGEPTDPGCKCGGYLSGGEYRMLRLAWNLWNGQMRNAIDVADLLDGLSDEWLRTAFTAIAVRNGGKLPGFARIVAMRADW